ncbi:Tuberous sclerosis 2-like protein [Apiospora arundinis]|uniref:Tuberous sclerosis 2-like protein n=1 Tax=Apiospora arundinis TaxID=335852 RepID=A0ABR2HYL4_9PEZI
MLRRLVSLGQEAGEGQANDDNMPQPSLGDDTSSPQESKINTGTIASVFKGLAGAAKLTKSPPAPLTTTGSIARAHITEQLHDSATHGLPQHHLEAFGLLKNGTTAERVAAANQLRYAVEDYPLNPVLDIWYAAKDLIDPNNAGNTRSAVWALLTACVKHPASTDLERKEYFQTITAPANPEDFHLQLAALVDLTKRGRSLSGFEYDIFPIVTKWLSAKFASVRAARKLASRSKGKAAAVGEDKDFADIFTLTMDLIKFNSGVLDKNATQCLLNTLVDICMTTGNTDDLRACIGVMDAIVTFGAIPDEKLKDFVQVLCSIHSMVPMLQKGAWHTLSMLCRSHNGHAVVRLLLGTLSDLPVDQEKGGSDKQKNVIREVRGSLSVLNKLVSKSTEKGYPTVPFTTLLDGLSAVLKVTNAWKVQLDIIRLANTLLGTPQSKVNPMIVDEDWVSLLDIVAACLEGVTQTVPGLKEPIKFPATESMVPSDTAIVSEEAARLISRIEQLLTEQSGSFLQRQDCIAFLARIHTVLPDSAAILVLNYFKEFRCCFPSDTQWETNLQLVLEALFANRHRSSQLRVMAVQAITEVYEMIELIHDQLDQDFVPSLMKSLLAGVTEEIDIEVLQEIVSFTTSIACNADYALFDHIIEKLQTVLQTPPHASSTTSGDTQAPAPPSSPDLSRSSQSLSDVVVRGYIWIFLKTMNTDVAKTQRLFDILISVAKSNSAEIDARLSAMKLLFRLRADWANRIFVTEHTDTKHVAAILYRTEESLNRKLAEEAAHLTRASRSEAGGLGRTSRGRSFTQNQPADKPLSSIASIRSGNSAKAAAAKYQQSWSASETDVLPEQTSRIASSVVYSYAPEPEPDSDGTSIHNAVLPMSDWLATVVALLQQYCDWEIYSFILVYLPSQLSNHSIFKSAVPQIQELRRLLCEQIRTTGFLEPHTSTGLRRSDVATCLFHTLTMILSYHKHFQKTEEDEIVGTFTRGIGHWDRSTKVCLHALSICCYELPMSTSKALVTILQKMSQIVTQSSNAIHILEFLACLARLPSLYSNFRQDEYRIVFGICFRYLQYVREKKASQRMSTASDPNAPGLSSIAGDSSMHPNASDDLPQYVYALAYHVITFWFLALKLPDRAKEVSFISKNLFTDHDGNQVSEEQAQITIDFMQRAAYADVDESMPDPHFTAERFGEILKRRWLIGNSIVTIEQATGAGYAQITKRQPSGTSSYMIHESFKAPPSHQERIANDIKGDGTQAQGNTVLPSHLLVHLFSTLPLSDQARPIPLPQDEALDRAMRTFDRSPTVDGHKVGVIYIGEGQTKETEILANVSGSSEYLEFLNGLGTLTRLKDATNNMQGLDRQYDTDGEYTFCWRDRVSEVVFHVTTQMPTNLEHDPQCTLKKRHIGNDFVNIIFNDSGLPFKFDTFPSQFNYVNIVITPESRASFVATRQRTPIDVKESFYQVQVMSKRGFPEVSPAADMKIVSLRALPDFIRLLALNASVFSMVWSSRDVGEYISPWRNRLREITRLRERHGPKYGMTPSPPGTSLGLMPSSGAGQLLDANKAASTVRDSFSSLRRSSVATFFSTNSDQNSHSHRSSMLSTTPTENTEINHGGDSLVDTVDFSKWG